MRPSTFRSRRLATLLGLLCILAPLRGAEGAEPVDTPPPLPSDPLEPRPTGTVLPPTGDAGLDEDLSTYNYPFSVQMLPIRSQGQDLKMAYMDVAPGRANGSTVLLLHGKNFSGAYWSQTMEALSELGYRVVVPDQVGFGKSSKPEAFQYSFQAMAVHTKQLLDSLGVDRVALVGHSMGGMLATRFALMFPERVTALVLVNPIGLEDWKLVVPYTPVDEAYGRELQQNREGIRAYMRENYFGGEWKPAYDPLVEIQAGWTEGPDYPRVAWVSVLTADMIFTQPVVYEFPHVKAPTLLIIGQRDRTALGKNLVSPEVAASLGDYPELGRKAAAAIPGARLVEFEGVGHVPQYEAPESYLRALTGFLGGVR